MERDKAARRTTAAGADQEELGKAAAQAPGQVQPRSRAGPSYRVVDAVVGAGVVLVGIVMMVDNHRIGSSWGDDGPQTGYFPFHIGAILCIAGAAVFLKSVLARNRVAGAFVTWDRFKLVLAVLLPTALFVLATQFLGIYVAATLFIASFMRLLGRTGWLKTASVSVGVSAVLFWMFEIQFVVPLPKGPLETLLGY